MLASLGTLLSYGSYLAYLLLDALLQSKLVSTSSPSSANGGGVTASWTEGKSLSQRFDLWAWAFTEDIRIGCVGLLAAFTAPLAWGLLLYHVYLVWAGMTTSESFKWDEWKEDVADGYVVKTSLPRGSDAREGVSATTTAGPDTGAARKNPNGRDGYVGNRVEVDDEVEPFVPWPGSCRERYASMANRLSRENEPGARTQGNADWRPVWDLRELTNIYDLGFWDNLVDVFRLS